MQNEKFRMNNEEYQKRVPRVAGRVAPNDQRALDRWLPVARRCFCLVFHSSIFILP
jgi:hypothetical protein